MTDINSILSRLTVYDIAKHLGIPLIHKNPQRSPFRQDRHPSFSVFNNGKKWKDHATGESGGIVDFYRMARPVSRDQAFREIINIFGTQCHSRRASKSRQRAIGQIQVGKGCINIPEFSWDIGKAKILSAQRGYNIDALKFAYDCGCFGFCDYYRQNAWMITDNAALAAQVRRLDGKPWNAGNKAITIKGSNAIYPIGIAAARSHNYVCMTEGSTDFLACFHFAYVNDLEKMIAPISMLGANQHIGNEFLPLFNGKDVLIIPDHDKAGHKALRKWGDAISGYARTVSYFDFGKCQDTGLPHAKDLCEFMQINADQWESIRPCDNPFLGLIK